jgi:hypothetical protein
MKADVAVDATKNTATRQRPKLKTPRPKASESFAPIYDVTLPPRNPHELPSRSLVFNRVIRPILCIATLVPG